MSIPTMTEDHFSTSEQVPTVSDSRLAGVRFTFNGITSAECLLLCISSIFSHSSLHFASSGMHLGVPLFLLVLCYMDYPARCSTYCFRQCWLMVLLVWSAGVGVWRPSVHRHRHTGEIHAEAEPCLLCVKT